VRDAQAAAEFYAWLFDLISVKEGDHFRVRCANGDILIDADNSKPVAMGWSADGLLFNESDPDGVPVVGSSKSCGTKLGTVVLDHVRLNCGDIQKAINFYQRFGLVATWSNEEDAEGLGVGPNEPARMADWVHLSGDDGYVSLSQADWLPCGVGMPASGPPRFIHVGMMVSDISVIVARLNSANVPYIFSEDPVGRRLYLNDPDGIASLGNNLEIIEYGQR
jgi:catechol 2,3-dioxygenase-like lactoylglutathione lyase family enzyme